MRREILSRGNTEKARLAQRLPAVVLTTLKSDEDRPKRQKVAHLRAAWVSAPSDSDLQVQPRIAAVTITAHPWRRMRWRSCVRRSSVLERVVRPHFWYGVLPECRLAHRFIGG